MKTRQILSTACLLILISACGYSQRFIPAFHVHKNPLELSRPAQPAQYMDKTGRKAALIGNEAGSFEAWIWPWKVLRNFELSFYLENSTRPISAADIVRTISVTPELTRLTYVYESFSVTADIFVPNNEQGILLLLEANTTKPLRIVPGFIPVIQPQWPAGVGGQYSYWDDDLKAFVLSASAQKVAFLCGSPAGEGMSAPPAHMLSDSPLQFNIPVKPHEMDGQYIPIVIAGETFSKFDSVKALYSRLWKNAEQYYLNNVKFYKELRDHTLKVITPDKELNLAFEWGKVALRNLMVTNPKLGTGLVAGYGWSGTGERPGFAWYFGGDAFINSLAMSSYGDFGSVKDALQFTQKWQRQDSFPVRKKNPGDPPSDVGKMAHELSQSEGIIDWWNDYHYGYNHADTSPWYLVAAGDYFSKTGDTAFLKYSWKSLVQAFEWCIGKDSNHDGLMDLKGAGLGVLEFGSLVNIYNDNYTQGLWVQALRQVILMADKAGDPAVKEKAEKLLEKALPAMEKIYWMDDLGFYSYGANEKGEQVKEKSPYPGASLMFGLFDEARSVQTLKAFNASDLTTDWGIRNLSDLSQYYGPENYNYGAVWGFTNYFLNTAQYRYHFGLPAFYNLKNTAAHIFDHALGVCPEVLSGELNTKLAEAYHDQGFSVSGFIVPLVRGMAGLEVEALKNRISFRPLIPADWDSLILRNIDFKGKKLDFEFRKIGNNLVLSVINPGHAECEIEFSPVIQPGTKMIAANLNGKAIDYEVIENEQGNEIRSIFTTGNRALISYALEASAEIYLLPWETVPGQSSQGLKVISQSIRNKIITLVVEGLPRRIYSLGIKNKDEVISLEGARLEGDRLGIFFEKTGAEGFTRKEIRIKVK